MVQLNTTYDKSLKSKIFVLKGEESYARTTDVLAYLISDYKDCNSKIDFARVGLEIDVLREVGNGFIYIYDNELPLFPEPIPWSHNRMDEIIDSTWNEKGVYWLDNRLIIGRDVDDDISFGSTGFKLAYDTDHKIIVKYSGNKNCLGSVSDVIDFNMPTPDLYYGELIFNCPKSGNRYDKGASVNDITITFSSEFATTNKSVDIYIDGQLAVEDIELTNDIPSTLTLGTLDEGKHTITAIFTGDDEIMYTEESIDISVGYNLVLTDCPQVAVISNPYEVQCSVVDHFGVGVYGADVVGVEYISGWGYEQCSQTGSTNEDGEVTLHQYSFTNNVNKINYMVNYISYYSDELPTTKVNVDRVSISSTKNIANRNDSYVVEGYLYDNNDAVIEVANIPVTINDNGNITTVRTNANGKYSYNINARNCRGNVTYTASVFSESSNPITVEEVYQYWSPDPSLSYEQYLVTKGEQISFGANEILITLGCRFMLKNIGDSKTSDYEITIPIKSHTSLAYVRCGKKLNDETQYTSSHSISNGDVIKITNDYTNGMRLYKNGVLLETISSTEHQFPLIEFLGNYTYSSQGYVAIDSLKWKKMVNE